MILARTLKVLRKSFDPLREECHLDFGRTRIFIMHAVARDSRLLLFCRHLILFAKDVTLQPFIGLARYIFKKFSTPSRRPSSQSHSGRTQTTWAPRSPARSICLEGCKMKNRIAATSSTTTRCSCLTSPFPFIPTHASKMLAPLWGPQAAKMPTLLSFFPFSITHFESHLICAWCCGRVGLLVLKMLQKRSSKTGCDHDESNDRCGERAM